MPTTCQFTSQAKWLECACDVKRRGFPVGMRVLPGNHRSRPNSTGKAVILNDRLVPEAEVNQGDLNVGFGDVGYLRCKGIGGRAYRMGGLRETEDHTRKYARIYYLFKYFSADKLAI